MALAKVETAKRFFEEGNMPIMSKDEEHDLRFYLKEAAKGVGWIEDTNTGKELDEGMENRKILNGTDNKVATAEKDKLFTSCNELGRDEIHYRGEMYLPKGKTLESYKKLANLKFDKFLNLFTFDFFCDIFQNGLCCGACFCLFHNFVTRVYHCCVVTVECLADGCQRNCQERPHKINANLSWLNNFFVSFSANKVVTRNVEIF